MNMNKLKKVSLGFLAAVMLFGGLATPVQAGATRRVIVSAALIFNTATATNAAGQIHSGATMTNTSALVNNRRSGHITNNIAANGWGNRVMWTHGSNLGGAILPEPR